MKDLLLILSGAIAAGIIEWGYRYWVHAERQGLRQQAEAVLKKHGLSPCPYLASVGVDDPELRRALVEMEHYGYVFLDAEGNVVGRIVSKSTSTRPHLRLVVSNK